MKFFNFHKQREAKFIKIVSSLSSRKHGQTHTMSVISLLIFVNLSSSRHRDVGGGGSVGLVFSSLFLAIFIKFLFFPPDAKMMEVNSMEIRVKCGKMGQIHVNLCTKCHSIRLSHFLVNFKLNFNTIIFQDI